MKTSFALLLCIPLIAAAAQNRVGAPANAGTGQNNSTAALQCPNDGTCVNAATCPNDGTCPNAGNALGFRGGRGNGVGQQGGGCLGQNGGGAGRRGFGMGRGPGSQGCAVALPEGAVTSLSAAQLNAAIEEERVAHDLYVVASEKWQLPVFNAIALAETRHAAALTALASASAITPPLAVAGTYATADLQSMYASLRPLMLESENAALKAGAFVEESDIKGLRALLASDLDPATRQIVTNLERASRHHLVAFVRNLTARGATYTPQVLPAAEFAEILGG